MSDYIPVEGNSGLYRDSESTAIINKDKKAYLAYMERKKTMQNKKLPIGKPFFQTSTSLSFKLA